MPEEVRADLLLGRDTLSPGLVKAGQAASDASSNVRQLTRDLYEAGKQRATPVMDLNDAAAEAKLADVSAKLKDLGAKAANPNVDLKDKEAVAGITAMRVKLDALGKKVASPRITLEGLGRAEAGIAALDLQLDRLSRKHAVPSVGGGGFFSTIKNLFAGGAAGGAAGGGGLAALLGGAGGGLGAAAAAILAATLAPAALPVGLGALVGGGGAFGALKLGAAAQKQLQALQSSLSSAKGGKRENILGQIKAFQQGNAGELAVFGAFQGLGKIAQGVFSGALTGTGRGFSGGPGGHLNASFLTGLAGILKQIGGFVKSIGPELGNLFRASLPYLQAFTDFLEKAAKLVLPAFVQMLNEMAPFLPVIEKGLLNIVKGFVGFLNAIGPSGMRASARIFVILTEGMAAVLVALGHAINWLTENIPTWVRKIHNEWDVLRHDTAVIFDGIRHEIAHVWDMIFQDSIGRVIRGGHDIEREWSTWTHNIGVIFDAFRHSAAEVWDAIWRNTAGRTERGVSDVIGWFKRLPGEALRALFGLGHELYAFARAALSEFWGGFKSIGGSILNWIGNFASSIWNKVKSFFQIGSPSKLFYGLGKNLMLGLFHGIRDHAHHAVNAVGGATAAIGGSAASAQAYGRRLAGSYGWASQWADINAVAMRESGWSPTARNPSSGAYGIAQFINGPSEYYQYGGSPGTVAGQVTAFFNYIKQRYGNPAAAWGHELSYGWYDQGGWLKPGLTLAYNATGRPEMVVPNGASGSAGGQTVIVNVNVGHGTHPVAAARELAKILNAGAHSGVKLRTSILGPG